jgi:hypothetical protein
MPGANIIPVLITRANLAQAERNNEVR